MGLLEEHERQRSQKLRRQHRIIVITFKTIFLMFVFVLLCVMVAVIATELWGVSFLTWIDQHPTFAARFNTHHWLSRGIALLILLLLAHKIWLVFSFSVKRLLVWWKWWTLWRSPSVTEPEQPAT